MHTSSEIQHCKLRESFLRSWGSLSTTLRQDLCLFCYKTQKTTVQKQERRVSFFQFPQLGCCGYCLSLSVKSRYCLYYSGVSWCTFVGKTLNRPKEMKAVSTKVLLRFFSSSLPICAVYFDLVMPRHLLRPCSARYEHTRGMKRYVT
jgi:hypothetical protein